ncbi:MAG: tetratricopeptide repeat protein, partial [Alphaproteobacteria bacterium]|nr:tetratricopeptide repeat protein [Alphaproteobacteria bacterium]
MDEAQAQRGERLLAAGRIADAVAAFEQAVELAPDRASHWSRLLNALARAGAAERVAATCQHLLVMRPDCGVTRLAIARA